MHSKASPRPDREAQRAVLALALAAHPKSLTIPELAREIDSAEQAAVDLVGVGLLVCQGISIQPSGPALYFDRLELP